jgi:hypothetical protein
MLLARRPFREPHVIRRQFETIARRIIPPICEREQIHNFARALAVAAEQGAATLVRIRLDAVRVDFP